MRSIQQQFLLPVLAVVIGSTLLSSLLTVAWLHRAWQAQESARLAELMQTFSAPSFPLSETVLERMSELAQSEFVTLGQSGEFLAASFEPTGQERAEIVKVARRPHGTHIEPMGVELSARTQLVRLVELPARRSDGARYLLAISRRDGVDEQALNVVLPPLLIGLITCIAVLLLIRLGAARLVRPIEQLAAHATRLSAGDFQPSAVATDCREIASLRQAMNDLVARLNGLLEQARRRERLQALDQLSGSIAHQLRNAATGARLALDLIRREHATPNDPSLTVADDQLRFIESCCQRFLGAAKRDPSELAWKPTQRLLFTTVVQDAVARVRPLAVHSSVSIDTQIGELRSVILGDDEALRQVVENLLINAIEAVRRPEVLERRLRVELHGDAEWATLAIGDMGQGPDTALVDAIFEPLVTDKPSGTGLGLALVREVVTTHGGVVSWRREPPWTWFEIRLPFAASEARHVEMAHR